MNLLEKFRQYIQKEHLFEPKDKLLLAVSGGVDSVVLCALCKQAGYDFIIAHCNFQLRGDDSKRDEKFVTALAQQYGVEFHVKVFATVAHSLLAKKSIEETARDLRYKWFDDLTTGAGMPANAGNKTGASKARYILTAHHADDNIETVLMNFFRGTGLTGLRGIQPKSGKIIRPLLFARRSELEMFVNDNQLEYVNDDTNQQNEFTRNYFRNTIIPLVKESFPEAAKNVLRNIQRFREADILYQQSIQLHKKKLLEQKGNEIHIPVLKLAKTVPLSTIVYEIIRDFGFTAHQTEETLALLESGSGKYIQSATHRILKNRNWLIISPRLPVETVYVLVEEKDAQIIFAGGVISMSYIPGTQLSIISDSSAALLDLSVVKFPLLLRKWKQGDYFYPLGMQKKKKLSRFFIDQKLSLGQKENTWVVEMDKKIIWIVGVRIDNRFKVTPGTKSILRIDYSPK